MERDVMQAFMVAMAATAVLSIGCGPSMDPGSTGTGASTGSGGAGGGTGSAGTGGGASCNADAACGGDIVGVWEFASACNLDGPRPEGFCSQQTVVSQVSVTGTYTFGADGTATFDGTYTGTVNEILPAACLVDPLSTCAALDADVKQRVAAPGSVYKSAACTAASSGGCACVWSFKTTATTSATYTTTGSTLTLTNTSSGTTGTSSYCVQGSTLVISYPPATPGGPPIIYVLTKR
jgi:hypothetical protein